MGLYGIEEPRPFAQYFGFHSCNHNNFSSNLSYDNMLRRRPTALPWYIRLRISKLVLLVVAACLFLALFLDRRPYSHHITAGGPLAGILAAVCLKSLKSQSSLIGQ